MNNTILSFFYNFAHQSDFFDGMVIFFAVYFPVLILFGICAFLFYRSGIYKKNNLTWIAVKKLTRELTVILGPAFVVYFVATILKEIIHIDRSFTQFDKISPLFNPNQQYSFPSTHAAIFSALACSVFFVHKKAGYILMILAIIIGLARIIAG